MRRWTLLTGALLVTVALAGTIIVNDPATNAAACLAYMLWIGGLVLAVALVWELVAWALGRTKAT